MTGEIKAILNARMEHERAASRRHGRALVGRVRDSVGADPHRRDHGGSHR